MLDKLKNDSFAPRDIKEDKKNKRVRVAAVIIIEDNILLMHRTNVKNRQYNDYYTFPGGGVEENETYEEAVIREIKEELGICIKAIKNMFEIVNEGTKEYFYLCDYISGEFGTGKGPEFLNDPRYMDNGMYIPEKINKHNIQNILLLPNEAKMMLINYINNINM